MKVNGYSAFKQNVENINFSSVKGTDCSEPSEYGGVGTSNMEYDSG